MSSTADSPANASIPMPWASSSASSAGGASSVLGLGDLGLLGLGGLAREAGDGLVAHRGRPIQSPGAHRLGRRRLRGPRLPFRVALS